MTQTTAHTGRSTPRTRPARSRWLVRALLGLLPALPVQRGAMEAPFPATAALPAGPQLDVTPDTALAGSIQRLAFRFLAGADEISAGGGFRFELPVAYGETEPSFFSRPQNSEPEVPGFFFIIAAGGAAPALSSSGIAGGIIECTLRSSRLPPGTAITIHYFGMVQSLARKISIRCQWRPRPTAPWQACKAAQLTILPRQAATLIAYTPLELQADSAFTLTVAAIDRFGNRATGFRGRLHFTSTDPRAALPDGYTFTAADAGIHKFSGLVYQTLGFQKVTVRGANLTAHSNYALVAGELPPYRRLFGDTHFHTGTGTRNRGFISPPSAGDINTTSLENFKDINLGGDHRGNFSNAADAYAYARDVVGLDFASSSEHDAALFDSLAWQLSQAISDSFNAPGAFTTFFAYEWTAPPGHHIVLYKDRGQGLFRSRDYPTLPALWQALDRQGAPALTVPHVTWPFSDHRIWQSVNNEYRRIGEIYSLWNGRFLVQPNDDPQRFELGPGDKWSYQYAWKAGQKLGLVGSSDNHLGHPGANNYTIYTHHTGGFAVVLAESNTRENLWQALQQRRTYATTGTRIYLAFTADGHPMGSEFASRKAPVFRVQAAGTNKIERASLIKFDGVAYRTIHAAETEGEIADFEFTDTEFDCDSMYYVRVKQVDEYPGRPFSTSTAEMAWSSPIWIQFKK